MCVLGRLERQKKRWRRGEGGGGPEQHLIPVIFCSCCVKREQKMTFEDLEKYLGQQSNIVMEIKRLQTSMATLKRNEGRLGRSEVGSADTHSLLP